MHELDYTIVGEYPQMVEIEIPPGNAVIGNIDCLVGMDTDIETLTVVGDGARPINPTLNKLGLFVELVESSEDSITTTVFRNSRGSRKRIYFRGQTPGLILPIQMQDLSGQIIINKKAFLCSAKGAEIDYALTQVFDPVSKIDFAHFRSIRGDGWIFLASSGMLSDIHLHESESLLFDPHSIVAFDPQLTLSFQRLKGAFPSKNMARVSGPGRVWFQSHRIQPNLKDTTETPPRIEPS